MKKFIIVILFLVIFSLSGCLLRINEQQLRDGQIKKSISSNQEEILNFQSRELSENQLIAATSSESKREIKRFYPDSASLSSEVNSDLFDSIPDPEKSFTITSELIAKMHLIDRYNPGGCFGLPGHVSQSAIDSLINDNRLLSNFVKQKYKLSSDLEIYNKLKQFQNIQLTSIASSKYKFQFMDGQCCVLTFYQGVIEINGDKIIEVIDKKETKTNPC